MSVTTTTTPRTQSNREAHRGAGTAIALGGDLLADLAGPQRLELVRAAPRRPTPNWAPQDRQISSDDESPPHRGRTAGCNHMPGTPEKHARV